MEYTPGPWKAINMDGKYFPSVLIGKPQPYSDRSGKHQARIVVNESHDSQMKTIQANARLIAVAPDLLEACKELLDLIDTLEYAGEPVVEQDCMKKATRAITKATKI